jgi:hypothetical protein
MPGNQDPKHPYRQLVAVHTHNVPIRVPLEEKKKNEIRRRIEDIKAASKLEDEAFNEVWD